MKTNLVIFWLFVLLTISALPQSIEFLPFLNGRNIYWLIIIALFSACYPFFSKTSKLKVNIFDLLVLLLFFISLIQFYFFSTITCYNLAVWRFSGYFALYFLLRNTSSNAIQNNKILRALIWYIAATAFVNIVLMISQLYGWIDSQNDYFAVTGIFFSPNHLGVYLALGCISLLFLRNHIKALWYKILVYVFCALLFAGLCYTSSRGALISLFIALLYYYFRTSKQLRFNITKGIFITLIGVCSIMYILSISKNKANSNSGRFFYSKTVDNANNK